MSDARACLSLGAGRALAPNTVLLTRRTGTLATRVSRRDYRYSIKTGRDALSIPTAILAAILLSNQLLTMLRGRSVHRRFRWF